MAHRVRHHLHIESIRSEARNRQTDAVDRDRSLVHDIRGEQRRKAHREPVKIGVGTQLFDVADGIDVTLDEVTAQSAVCAQRPFEIQPASRLERAERRDANGFGPDVGLKLVRVGENDRQAHAVDRHAVAA